MKSKILCLLALALSACSSPEEMEYEQYLVNGESLYQTHCANCHGKEGEGLQNLYPALKENPNLKNLGRVVCLIRNGEKAKESSNGQAMPANPKLYNLDIAQLTTYLLEHFGDSKQKLSPEEVKDYLEENCPN
ncbi:cytochrome c [Marinilongibacter aquaticus]|uniref:c-type cytochrome n=1 Tax=Marinilongibacter aquaticus TaxID=2975157 RepID=UPI0021BD1371|nr:cytochrome c [Marinilongibacter aquaticus]UBM58871.1 cytochrome c [Marinilongibacter aquaticus]